MNSEIGTMPQGKQKIDCGFLGFLWDVKCKILFLRCLPCVVVAGTCASTDCVDKWLYCRTAAASNGSENLFSLPLGCLLFATGETRETSEIGEKT